MAPLFRSVHRWIPAPASALPIVLAVGAFVAAGTATAQTGGASTLPATAPTTALQPLSATGPLTSAHPGGRSHRAQVSCADGQLSIQADNSSLNGILRAISRCTGMRIIGGVADQRVFGNYGPAASATVLATLLDGTGSNMVLRETAAAAPAELELTPRTVGVIPPSPNMVADDEVDSDTIANGPGAAGTAGNAASGNAASGDRARTGSSSNAAQGVPPPANQTPYPGTDQSGASAAPPGSTFTGPVSIPQPINNVNGSSSNASPTASTYPTTNSVPLDSLPTPSTTPSANGIVDAPNPPAPGSDTAHLLGGAQGSGATVPGNPTLTSAPTNTVTDPGATNTSTSNTGTTAPAANPAPGSPATGPLTPEQVYQQLQQIRRQQQQQQAPTTPPPS